MVGVAGRSKACSRCRERKIKCDLRLPQCSQCRRSERHCPGPRRGALFLNAAAVQQRPGSEPISLSLITYPTIATTAKEQQISRHPAQGGHINESNSASIPSISPQSAISDRHHVGDFSESREVGFHCLLPPNPQPSRATIFEQLFVSHFIESFGGNRKLRNSPFWVTKLPAILASSETADTTGHCIRATTAMFYGNLTGSVSIQNEAYKWYGKAVQSLRTLIEQSYIAQGEHTARLAEDVICAPVMLYHFEVMTNMASEAWMQHIDAAAMMLGKLGPEKCRSGLAHQFFLTVRHFIVFIYMTTTRIQPHEFASHDWMTIPLEGALENPFDRLINILLSHLLQLSMSDENTYQKHHILFKAQSQANSDALALISALDAWQLRFMYRMSRGNGRKEAGLNMTCDDTGDFPHPPPSPFEVSFLDVPTAAFISLYHAASIKAFLHLSLISGAANLYEDRMEQHAQVVISASTFIATCANASLGGGSMLLIFFPLKVVSLWSPSICQRNYALRCIHSWCRQSRV